MPTHARTGTTLRSLVLIPVAIGVAAGAAVFIWMFLVPHQRIGKVGDPGSSKALRVTRKGRLNQSPKTTTTTSTLVAPLLGKTIVLDPGHNGGNFQAPAYIDQPVWNGREAEACDTTGTETASGYTEAQFNFTVAAEVQRDLEALGATVILTRTTNSGVGPCITQRTAIGNQAHAAVALSIHADGGPISGRGFVILEPVADGPNDNVVAASDELALDLRGSFAAETGMPESTYDGLDGLAPRDDLAGVNLTTVPKVFIECGNMKNATDAALLIDPTWQQRAAAAIAQALEMFVLQASPLASTAESISRSSPVRTVERRLSSAMHRTTAAYRERISTGRSLPPPGSREQGMP